MGQTARIGNPFFDSLWMYDFRRVNSCSFYIGDSFKYIEMYATKSQMACQSMLQKAGNVARFSRSLNLPIYASKFEKINPNFIRIFK